MKNGRKTLEKFAPHHLRTVNKRCPTKTKYL